MKSLSDARELPPVPKGLTEQQRRLNRWALAYRQPPSTADLFQLIEHASRDRRRRQNVQLAATCALIFISCVCLGMLLDSGVARCF